MEELIFVLPILIIFFFILFQIFAFFKRGFDFVRSNFDLTIDQAGEGVKDSGKQMESDYDQEQVKKRIAEAEKESFSESKERILKQKAESESKKRNEKKLKKENLKKQKSKKQNSSLGEIFSQYNEVEKAVIYNEILSKPKSLKKK